MHKLLLGIIFVSSVARAGLHLEMDQKGSTPKENCKIETLFDTGFARVNIRCMAEIDMSMIYDDKTETNFNVDNKKKAYWSMTLAESRQIWSAMKPQFENMKRMQEQMAAQMKNMPPEQRKMMEKMMGARTTFEPVRKSGKADRVGSYNCKIEEIWMGQEKTQELCFADWPQMKIDFSKYVPTASKWQAHFTEMAKFSQRPPNARESAEWTKGVAVRTRSFHGGKQMSETLLTSIKEESLSADLGKPPAGYKKESGPMEKMKEQAKAKKK